MSLSIQDAGINVQISRETRAPSQRGFGSLLFLDPVATVTNRIKGYTSLASVALDHSAGSEPYKAALSYYSQLPSPVDFLVGEILQGSPFVQGIHAAGSITLSGIAASTDNFILDIDGVLYPVGGISGLVLAANAVGVFDITGTVAVGDGDVGLAIDGVNYIVTPLVSDTADIVGTALETAINLGATHTAVNALGVLTITAVTPGTAGNAALFTDISTDTGAITSITAPAGGVDAIAGTTAAEIATLLALEINQGSTHTAIASLEVVDIVSVLEGVVGNGIVFTVTQTPVDITEVTIQPSGGTDDIYATAGENLADALSDMLTINSDFFCVIVSQGINDTTEADNVAAWVGANDRVFVAQTADITVLDPVDVTSIMFRYKAAGYGSVQVVYSNDPDAYISASAFGVLATTSFRGTDTVKTQKFKDMPGVITENLAPDNLAQIHGKFGNSFYETANIRMFDSGRTSGGSWLDEIHGAAALAEEIRVRVFGLLSRVSTKVAYTELGMARLEAEVEGALGQFETNGYLASRVDENGDILPAYSIWHIPVIDVSATDKANRIAPDIEFTARLAGAIHAVTINGTLTLD